jgi:hypothetical protein
MHEVDPSQTLVNDLISRLGLQPGDPTRAYGEIGGSPVTMTVLGGDPLSLLFGFKIVSPHPEVIYLSDELDFRVTEERADVSLEDGMAWLTLRDLREETSEEVQRPLLGFAASLAEAELVFPPGCVSCGCLEDAELVFSEGRASRLCPACAERIVSAKNEAEHQLNKPTTFHAFGLPLAFLAVAAGWLVFWFCVDLMVSSWKQEEIVVNDLTVGVLIALLAGVGLSLGLPLGFFLRRSGVTTRAPVMTTIAAVLPACMAGELLYIVAVVFWMAGFIDFLLAMRLFIPFVTSYSVAWIIGKVAVIIGVAVGCHVGMKSEKKVSVRL